MTVTYLMDALKASVDRFLAARNSLPPIKQHLQANLVDELVIDPGHVMVGDWSEIPGGWTAIVHVRFSGIEVQLGIDVVPGGDVKQPVMRLSRELGGFTDIREFAKHITNAIADHFYCNPGLKPKEPVEIGCGRDAPKR